MWIAASRKTRRPQSNRPSQLTRLDLTECTKLQGWGSKECPHLVARLCTIGSSSRRFPQWCNFNRLSQISCNQRVDSCQKLEPLIAAPLACKELSSPVSVSNGARSLTRSRFILEKLCLQGSTRLMKVRRHPNLNIKTPAILISHGHSKEWTQIDSSTICSRMGPNSVKSTVRCLNL